MTNDTAATQQEGSQHAKPSVKIFGVGNAGLTVVNRLHQGETAGAKFAALDSDPECLDRCLAEEKLRLEPKLLRGLGSGGDPERGRSAAEEQFAALTASCAGHQAVFIVAGLGGGAGTGIAPVVARAAREAGALVVAFVVLPFACEGNRREGVADFGLENLREHADAVICLPNEKIFSVMDENSSVVDTFNTSSELLTDAVRGFWRLLVHKGLIELHFSEVCELLKAQQTDSFFAVAESMGLTRSRDVGDKLLSHPLLAQGQMLKEADLVLISIVGGPDLAMTEVNRLVQQVGAQCERAQVMMGAAISEQFRERMLATLICARKRPAGPVTPPESLDQQLLPAAMGARPQSRLLPPPPGLAPEKVQQIFSRQEGRSNGQSRKVASRLRQGQLPLEIVSKGRFDKSEPTIHRGEDLDVPTYIRRGVSLN